MGVVECWTQSLRPGWKSGLWAVDVQQQSQRRLCADLLPANEIGQFILEKTRARLPVRYLKQAGTPVGFDERRYTLGLDYWIFPFTALKVAYEFDEKTGTGRDQNAFMLQMVTLF
jgi:hypothetical protein